MKQADNSRNRQHKYLIRFALSGLHRPQPADPGAEALKSGAVSPRGDGEGEGENTSQTVKFNYTHN